MDESGPPARRVDFEFLAANVGVWFKGRGGGGHRVLPLVKGVVGRDAHPVLI